MKQRHMYAAVFFLCGMIFAAHAQDLIILKDGNMLEAKVIEMTPAEVRYRPGNNATGPLGAVPTSNVLSIKHESAKKELLIFRDGEALEARVMEVTPTEIRYKPLDNLDGPMRIVPSNNVLSFRYANGKVEIVNAAPPSRPANAAPANTVPANRPASAVPVNRPVNAVPATGQKRGQSAIRGKYARDTDDFVFGISLNPAGMIPYAGGGPAISLDFTKGRFNTLVDLRSGLGFTKTFWGTEYFGITSSFNYFHPSRIGGLYVGGVVEYSLGYGWADDSYWGTRSWNNGDGTYYNEPYYYEKSGYRILHRFGVAAIIGYKFVLKSGVYFRTGVAGGYSFGKGNGLLIRPDITVGWMTP